MIRVIEAIPDMVSAKRKTYKSMVQADIEEAIEKRIDVFEFVGDYNFKYLAQTAREVASRLWVKKVRSIRKAVKDEWQEKGLKYFSVTPDCYEYKMFINIISSTGADRVHVYCEIDFDFFDTYKQRVEKEAEAEFEYQKAKEANE